MTEFTPVNMNSIITELGPGPELMTKEQAKLARQIPDVDLREEVHRQARMIADPPPSDIADAIADNHWSVTVNRETDGKIRLDYENKVKEKIERLSTERENTNKNVWGLEDRSDEIYYFLDKYKRDQWQREAHNASAAVIQSIVIILIVGAIFLVFLQMIGAYL